MTVDQFVGQPDFIVETASLQKFAKITPQYPGMRSPLLESVCSAWASAISPVLSEVFFGSERRFSMQAWFSVVTTKPSELLPIQRLPHVDGTDPDQIAMMLYLHKTDHGGTAFYRHKSTGYEALTAERFPKFRAALERDVVKRGMPKAAYPSDGAPYFERTHQTGGLFNQAVFYRGNILHSGVIRKDIPLDADPRKGRLTINAFLRPV